MANGYKISIAGLVQGVGFRPHVYQIATELKLAGSVHNDGQGVQITLAASKQQLAQFLELLTTRLPPLARIDSIEKKQSPQPILHNGFTIITSQHNAVSTQIAPDAATCNECLAELFDQHNRRFHYPFINCTHCGPRYSIIEKLPYDRPFTTMASFPLCHTCQDEYINPLDRRFHAQPNACPDCGPKLSLFDAKQNEIQTTNLIKKTIRLLTEGAIVAIKGLGGYHLVCDAYNAQSVARLRKLKQRETKPLSVMVADLTAVENIAQLPQVAKELLTSNVAPIVLLKKKNHQLDHLAPKMNSLGIMLPYTPLHHLLFQQADTAENNSHLALVMTSANLHGQPLIFHDDIKTLSSLADFVLSHNRKIHKRCDDSIINCVFEPNEDNHVEQIKLAHDQSTQSIANIDSNTANTFSKNDSINSKAIIIRRARGMTPSAITLPFSGKSTLAVGGYFKNTVCITKGDKAYLSQYIGNLDNPDNCRYLQETVAHMLNIFQITPEQVVADLHPDFYSSQFAQQFSQQHQIPLIKVQHHHAHSAAIACEHQLTTPYLALSLDGVGLGDDGQSWGGECLLIDNKSSQQLAHFKPLTLPGGDIAAKQPWRLASAFLHSNNLGAIAEEIFSAEPGFSIVKQMIKNNSHCPKTHSVGRLFDLAAAILGLANNNSFEAESAMRIEAAADYGKVRTTEPLFVIDENNQLDFTPLLLALVKIPRDDGAATFHYQLSFGLSQWLMLLAPNSTKQIVLSGGCFLNQKLTTMVTERLTNIGFTVYSASTISPNDSSLSLGQAWAVLTSQSNPLCQTTLKKGAETCA